MKCLGAATATRRLVCASIAVAACLYGPASAQPKVAAEANSGTQILFLGTSSGPPLHVNRSKAATLLIVDGREYLIDCGIGTMQRMLEAGIKSQDVKTIFFTHLHSDHDLGLADVMANDNFIWSERGASGPIDIYGPPQTKEIVDAAFHYITVSVRPFAAENPQSYLKAHGEFISRFVVHEFNRDGVIFQDDKIRVTAAENSHYALMPAEARKTLKSYAYRIETPHGVVVFTGDTGPSNAVARLANGADVLVSESSARDQEDVDQFVKGMAARNHWSPARAQAFRAHFGSEHLVTSEVGQLAAAARVKAVILHHYTPTDRADQQAYIAGVKKHFSGPVFAPDDLDRYCMPSASTGIAPCGHAMVRSSPR